MRSGATNVALFLPAKAKRIQMDQIGRSLRMAFHGEWDTPARHHLALLRLRSSGAYAQIKVHDWMVTTRIGCQTRKRNKLSVSASIGDGRLDPHGPCHIPDI
jgi:hypothetical protein